MISFHISADGSFCGNRHRLDAGIKYNSHKIMIYCSCVSYPKQHIYMLKVLIVVFSMFYCYIYENKTCCTVVEALGFMAT